MTSSDERLFEIARRQYGVVSRAQARSAGLTDRQIRRRLAVGRWELVHPATFRLAGAPPSAESAIVAAVLALPDAWISHGAASLLRGRPVGRERRPEITRRHGHGTTLYGVRVHQSTCVPPHHVTTLGSLPITTRARTVFDLASVLDVRRLGRFLDDELLAGHLALHQIERVHLDLAGPGRPGSRRMARVLDQRIGRPPTESELEEGFARVCRRHGLPPGTPQYRAPWDTAPRGRERVDVAYPEARLIVELDGRRYHGALEAMVNDRRRDQLALAVGWRTLRFTWSQIMNEESHVVDVLRRSLGLDR